MKNLNRDGLHHRRKNFVCVCVCVKQRECVCESVLERERERHGERKKTFFLTRFVDGIIKFPWNRGGEREDWFILFGSGGLKKISLHRKDISQDDGETRGRRSRRADKGSALPDFFSTSSRRPTFEECFQSKSLLVAISFRAQVAVSLRLTVDLQAGESSIS